MNVDWENPPGRDGSETPDELNLELPGSTDAFTVRDFAVLRLLFLTHSLAKKAIQSVPSVLR